MTLEELQAGQVICLDKPYQWTSFQAVNKVKAYIRHTYDLKKFKIGHAGTLDPLATGLLLVCIGKATKTIPKLQDGEKVYTGTMVLGATTPCYDLEREVDHLYPFEHITPELIMETRDQFLGDIQQVPPMFSAVKIDGQRAYEYARTDDPTVTIQPKTVTIHEFEITDIRITPGAKVTLPETAAPTPNGATRLYDNPQGRIPQGLPQIDFRIRCGKGTYIRSLARDLGLALGSGAFLSALRREQVGSYQISQAYTIDEIHNFFE